MTESVGDRIYMVRRALGPNARTVLPLREFAALLTRLSGRNYDPSELSKMERGARGVSLDDVRTIAAADPLSRGRDWLAWGDLPTLDTGEDITDDKDEGEGEADEGTAPNQRGA